MKFLCGVLNSETNTEHLFVSQKECAYVNAIMPGWDVAYFMMWRVSVEVEHIYIFFPEWGKMFKSLIPKVVYINS